MNPSKFYQACQECRRLKRKCSRDLPSCTHCASLWKPCRYSGGAPSSSHSLRHGESSQVISSATQRPNQSFPLPFFLDRTLFSPLDSFDSLTDGPQPRLRQILLGELQGSETAIFENFSAAVQVWLPFISRKRLLGVGQVEKDPCKDLLLLCMKINGFECDSTSAVDDPRYNLAKSISFDAENSGLLGLRLVQSLVLLTVYEISHSIYPAAFFTIGRAARIGLLMGWHNKNGNHLFNGINTWTFGEEQRRTWWAIFILDRIINMEGSDLQFARPDPSFDELLPINDDDWHAGKLSPNQPLYSSSFSSIAELGPFARLCQASHMLSKVTRHRECRLNSKEGVSELLKESASLHQALISLQLSIEETCSNDVSHKLRSLLSPATAICFLARYSLYYLYGCTDVPGPAGDHSAQEAEMQSLSLAGLRLLATSFTGLTQIDSRCPFLPQCYYFAAYTCAWFVQEDNEPEMWDALRCFVDTLRHRSKALGVAGEYLKFLGKRGTLDRLETEYNRVDG